VTSSTTRGLVDTTRHGTPPADHHGPAGVRASICSRSKSGGARTALCTSPRGGVAGIIIVGGIAMALVDILFEG